MESPANPAPLLFLEKIDMCLGDRSSALDWIQKAWLLEPDNLILIVELSGTYGLLGMHQKAIDVLLEGRKLYPEEPRILSNLGFRFSSRATLTRR